MPIPLRVLILEDNATDAELMAEELRRGGFDPDWQRVETEEGYLARLADGLSVILADYSLPQFDAPRALRLLLDRGLSIPFIVVSGAIGEEVAVAIMREGASDYILKDRMGRLASAVAAVLEKRRLRDEKQRAEEAQRQAERRYWEIFENAIEGIYQRTPEGEVLAANPALIRMLGYSFADEITGTFEDLAKLHVDPERRAEYLSLLEASDVVRGFECQLRRKDGTAIWVSLSTRAVRANDGKVVHYNSTIADVSELKATGAALEQSREELRELAARLLGARENESKRLGRELHDAFSQKLALLGIEVGLLRTKPANSQEEFNSRISTVSEKITELAKGLQQTSRSLHPSVLYDLGLSEALNLECAAFTRQSGIPAKFRSRNAPDSIPDYISLCLYRIAQESLWNIRKHAGASRVSVVLGADDGHVVLTVKDNGRGFLPTAVRGRGGLGLVSMEERVRLANGRLSIESQPETGTQIQARVPFPGSREPS
jgi:two-component system sensor histidine kinase UhpB